MMIPEYYSPSQATLFYTDRPEYYRRYLADNKLARTPQNDAMALGGAYDSYVSRAIAKRYLDPSDSRLLGCYDLATMLERTIDPHLNRKNLSAIGRGLFDIYASSGGLTRLFSELDDMDSGSLVMEDSVTYTCPINGFTLLGKPDIAFTRKGMPHVYDMKVNGYFSKSGVSPIKNHIWQSGTGKPHKDCLPHLHECGTRVDIGGYFESAYIRQIATYSWALFGRTKPVVGGILQVACRPESSRSKVDTYAGRAITHVESKALISTDVLDALFDEFVMMHDLITSGHIFDELSRDDSDEMCQELELECMGLLSDPELASMIR